MLYTIITNDRSAEIRSSRVVKNIPVGNTAALLRVLFLDIEMEGAGDLHLFRFNEKGEEDRDGWASLLDDNSIEN